MLWCHGAQNIGLSNHKLKSTLKCTVWSQCTPVPDRQIDQQTNIIAIARQFVLTANVICQTVEHIADLQAILDHYCQTNHQTVWQRVRMPAQHCMLYLQHVGLQTWPSSSLMAHQPTKGNCHNCCNDVKLGQCSGLCRIVLCPHDEIRSFASSQVGWAYEFSEFLQYGADV